MRADEKLTAFAELARHGGYIPESRALLCRQKWTQLNYGWWTLLESHLTDSYKKVTEAARQQARKDLEDENNALIAKMRHVRGGQ